MMATKLLLYLTTLITSHYIASFIQVGLHYCLGHKAIGNYFYRIHLTCHHDLYAKNMMVTETYLQEESSLKLFFLIPISIVAFTGYFLIPLDILFVHLATMIGSFYAHVYIHVQYHLKHSWLNQFSWFRKNRNRHIIHHQDMSKNYAVIGFIWDKLFGTYEEISLTTSR